MVTEVGLCKLLDLDQHHLEIVDDLESKLVLEHSGHRRVGVALIGLGRMGTIHLYNIVRQPRAHLLHIFDVVQKRLDFMSTKYFLEEQNVKLSSTESGWQSILSDKRVEAIIVASPTQTHEKFVREALEAGKHVLCEKPLAKDPDVVRYLVELAKRSSLIIICAFNRRYDLNFRMVKKQADQGDVGKLRIIKTCSRDSPLPPVEYIKTSGGFFHDCFVHDLDVILWLSGELPSEIYTLAHCYDQDYRKLGDVDTALITMKFPSGLITATDIARHSATGYEQRLEVYGPKGCLKLDESTNLSWEKHCEYGLIKPNQCYSFSSRYLEAYAREINELLNHIEGNNILEKPNPDHLNLLNKVLIACEKSHKTRLPVTIEWTEDELCKANSSGNKLPI